MNDHDVIAQEGHASGGWIVRCRCGAVFTRSSREKALEAHRGHHGAKAARAALEGRSVSRPSRRRGGR